MASHLDPSHREIRVMYTLDRSEVPNGTPPRAVTPPRSTPPLPHARGGREGGGVFKPFTMQLSWGPQDPLPARHKGLLGPEDHLQYHAAQQVFHGA